MSTKLFLNTLVNNKDLSEKEAGEFLSGIMDNTITPVQAGALIIALRMKGESRTEIIGLIRVMRERMNIIQAPVHAVDVCGTGGDGRNTFNISTTAAFVVAGCGVSVVKHGNRAASSLSGSADVLEALGVNINLTGRMAERVLQEVGMVFLFAPLFHPALKKVALIRKELGIRTIFNVLGPFVNPALVKRQLIGVPNKEIAKKLARAAVALGYSHLMIVTSEDGLDEVSIIGKTHVFEVTGNHIKKYSISPRVFGFKKTSQKAFAGGNAVENARIVEEILNGKKGPQRDIVVLNSACALYVAGKTENIQEGVRLAGRSIDDRSAKNILEKLRRETQKYA